MVPGAGLEPARPKERQILNLLCLPISPPGQSAFTSVRKSLSGGATRSRTGLNGFAIRSITALLSRLSKSAQF